jgi:hypothetical protein
VRREDKGEEEEERPNIISYECKINEDYFLDPTLEAAEKFFDCYDPEKPQSESYALRFSLSFLPSPSLLSCFAYPCWPISSVLSLPGSLFPPLQPSNPP